MKKTERQQKIIKVLQDLNISNQEQLQSWLSKSGVVVTQASLSRDLNELGVVKVNGHYRLPEVTSGQSTIVHTLRVDRAGENLVVLKTDPLNAPLLAALIDRSKIPGVVGTIAGDNTTFVAVQDGKMQNKVVRTIIGLLKDQEVKRKSIKR